MSNQIPLPRTPDEWARWWFVLMETRAGNGYIAPEFGASDEGASWAFTQAIDRTGQAIRQSIAAQIKAVWDD